MPQDSLMPEDPRYVGLTTRWECVDVFADPVWQLTIQRRPWEGTWETIHASRWNGVMLDLASTLQQDTINAFLYGDPRDLSRAAASVAKVARRHQRRFQG